MLANWQIFLTVGLILSATSICILTVAISTNNWTVYEVDREGLVNLNDTEVEDFLYSNSLYFTRYRGLFRTCYSDEDVQDILSNAVLDDTSGSICVNEEGYSFENNEDELDPDYVTRNHLLRALLAFLVISLLLLAISFILGIVAACQHYLTVMFATTGLCWISFFFALLGMSVFGAVRNLEDNDIDMVEFPGGWNNEVHKHLQEYTNISFDYSYIVGWLATALCLLASMFDTISLYLLRKSLNKLPYGGKDPLQFHLQELAKTRRDSTWARRAENIRRPSNSFYDETYDYFSDELHTTGVQTRNKAYDFAISNRLSYLG